MISNFVNSALTLAFSPLKSSPRVSSTSTVDTSDFSSLESTFYNWSVNFADWNLGAMQQMQTNPNDQTTLCYLSTVATNDSVAVTTNFRNYVVGGFDASELLEHLLVVQLKLMSQFDDCGVSEMLIMADSMFSNLPEASGAGVNIVAQLGLGASAQDTAVYLAGAKFVDGYNDNYNWNKMGAGFVLFSAELLKFQSPEYKVDAMPLN